MKSGGVPLIGRLIAVGIVAVAAAYVVIAQPQVYKDFVSKDVPAVVAIIEGKLQSIHTPTPPIGNLTPVRDLRGTWFSSIRGKGLQLYGKFDTSPGVTQIYETGDIDLVIESVQDNIASGTIRYGYIYVSGTTSVPGHGYVNVPKRLIIRDSGAMPIQIRVSGSRLDFGTVNADGVTFSMQGNYTTDIMSGTMTATTAYGVVKGEFHLTRIQ